MPQTPVGIVSPLVAEVEVVEGAEVVAEVEAENLQAGILLPTQDK
jgi:hypothetical protein